ncbi:MAG: hypothetical protein ACOY42_09475 [Pseudomonadota bacterium]
MTAERHQELVIARFHRGIQAKMAVGERLAPEVALAAERIVEGLLGGGHLLIAGLGAGRHLAALLQQGIAHGFEFARPALPSILLEDGAEAAGTEEHPLGARIRALGRAEDRLILVAPGATDPALHAALRAAHSRDLPCILLHAMAGSDRLELAAHDIELSADSDQLSLALEVQLAVILALCTLIERHLFGGHTT